MEKLRHFLPNAAWIQQPRRIAEKISANSIQAAPVALAKTITAVAITKGAAASGSTLTLIKGALKIMAWTKAKTAVVVGVGLLLAAGTATVTIHHLKARDAWRDPNVTSEMVQNVPSQVRILPTRFPGGAEVMRANDSFDKFVGINVTVADIVGLAYRDGNVPVPSQRIIFNTAEPRERYDFAATLPHGASAALQQELRTKLGFVARRETREMGTDVLQFRVKRPDAPQPQAYDRKNGKYLRFLRQRPVQPQVRQSASLDGRKCSGPDVERDGG